MMSAVRAAGDLDPIIGLQVVKYLAAASMRGNTSFAPVVQNFPGII